MPCSEMHRLLFTWPVHTDRREVSELSICCSGCLWYKIPTWGWGGVMVFTLGRGSSPCSVHSVQRSPKSFTDAMRIVCALSSWDGQLVHISTALCETHGAPRHHNTDDIFGDKDF